MRSGLASRLALGLAFGLLVHAGDPLEPPKTGLEPLIHATLRSIRQGRFGDIVERVESVHFAHRSLDRVALSAETLIEAKLQMHHFRKAATFHLGRKLAAVTDGKDFLAGLRAMNLLQTRVPERIQRQVLGNKLANSPENSTGVRPELIRFLVLQGISEGWEPRLTTAEYDFLEEAGPRIDLSSPSVFSWETWSLDERFSGYGVEGTTVRYAGLTLKAGDVLLIDSQDNASGAFTGLTAEGSYTPHAGFFAILTRYGKKFPAVIEMHRSGIRAVPLALALSPKFSAAVEVYRHQGLNDGDRISIDRIARLLLRVGEGFDFEAREGSVNFTCTTLIQKLFDLLELRPIAARSTFVGKAPANLAQLELSASSILTPMDFARSPETKLVGWIDNREFYKLLARAGVLRSIRDLFAGSPLDLSEMPWMFSLNRWGVGQIRRDTLAGRAFLRVNGFTQTNFPLGPAPALAWGHQLRREIGRAVARLLRDGEFQASLHGPISFDTLYLDLRARGHIDIATAPIRRWFMPPCEIHLAE